MKYYTIFLGDKMFENVIDDTHSNATWGIGGLLWTSKKKAVACVKNLKNPVYFIEDRVKKLKVVELKRPTN